MTKKEKIKNLEIVTRIHILQQCTVYQMDELSHTTLYKKQHKQRLENIYSYFSKMVEMLTDAFNSEDEDVKKEMVSYVEICNEIDKVLTKVTIEV